MRTVETIPAKQKPQLFTRKRVAAYCRVSTQQEIQHHSLEAQRDYFNKLISKNPLWTLVGIYADEASGRNNEKMRAFQRMMTDCRERKIDLILVKSISRLGRNTVQLLQACEELKSLDIEVYFEVEKRYLSDPKSIKELTVLAAIYQHESESKSFATKWGIHVRFRDGSSGFANHKCYGYTNDDDGSLIPVPNEADTVRRIYRWRKEGCSLREIARRLTDNGVAAPRGGSVWRVETIRKMLKNEKYFGNVLLGKTFISDYFNGKQSENRGEYEKYWIANHQEAIIDSVDIEVAEID